LFDILLMVIAAPIVLALALVFVLNLRDKNDV
jgi:hypothetical protein